MFNAFAAGFSLSNAFVAFLSNHYCWAIALVLLSILNIILVYHSISSRN